MLYAVIMAGGSGARFWPASRRHKPKQLLALGGTGNSMLSDTVARVAGMIPKERTVIITGRDQTDAVCEDLKDFPRENILSEPCPRNTAACVAWAAIWIRALDPDATMVVLAADHIIEPVEEFHRMLSAAEEFVGAQPDSLLTFGIQPKHPATGFGWIEHDEESKLQSGVHVHKVRKFTEKPDLKAAQSFLKGGKHSWNSGMFVWKAAAILQAIEQHCSKLHEALPALMAAAQDPQSDEFESAFGRLPSLPIDIAVMERHDAIWVMQASFHWSDVGTWASFAHENSQSPTENAAVGGSLVTENAEGVLAWSEQGQTIAVVGVDNIVVVRDGDETLIVHRDAAEDVKALVESIRKQQGDSLL